MKKTFLLIPLMTLALVGCTMSNKDSMVSDPVTETGPKQIVASFYPLAFMAEQIVGDKATVTNLAGASDVHDYAPSPQDMVKLNQANLVIFQGAELEPWTEDVIPELERKGVPTLEVSHDLDLAKMEEHEAHEEDHHGEFDPHTWLDPVLAQSMVDAILKALIEVDPAQQEVYTANAQKLKDRFAKLDKQFQADLSNCTLDEVIISHDALGYLARRYDFHPYAIAGLSTQDEPSAKILAELKEQASGGITHILVEQNNIRRFADMLQEETGLEELTMNPMGRGTLDPSKTFFDVMDENRQNLKTALNCGL